MKTKTITTIAFFLLPALFLTNNIHAQRKAIIINGGKDIEVYSDKHGDDDFHHPYNCKERKPMPPTRWSLRVGFGMPSDINTDYFTDDPEYFNYRAGSLSKYYGPYTGPVKSTGSLSVGGEYLITRWFAVGADLSTDMLYCSMYDSLTDQKTGTHRGVSLSFIPMLRFYYMNRPKVRLYGSFGLGAVAYFGYNLNNGNRINGNKIYYSGNFVELAGQYTPIGVEFGRRIYGFAEAGLGTIYSGVRAGVGIKL